MTATDYNKQATDFCERFGVTVKIKMANQQTCPPWTGPDV